MKRRNPCPSCKNKAKTILLYATFSSRSSIHFRSLHHFTTLFTFGSLSARSVILFTIVNNATSFFLLYNPEITSELFSYNLDIYQIICLVNSTHNSFTLSENAFKIYYLMICNLFFRLNNYSEQIILII